MTLVSRFRDSPPRTARPAPGHAAKIACAPATLEGGTPPGFGGAEADDNSITGCVPLNLFGNGAPSQAAIDFVTNELLSESTIDQRIFSGFVTGPIFTLPAGDVAVSAGFEFRRERASFTPDAFLQEGLGRNARTFPTAGGFDTKEGFAEIDIPVFGAANRLPFFYSLALEGRARFIDNSRSGSDWVYTGGARWSPIRDVQFRGNYTRSVRSPALTELFLPLSSIFTFGDDPCDSRFIGQGPAPDVREANCLADFAANAPGIDPGTFRSRIVNATVEGTSVGDPNLENEEATAWTVGTVIRPSFLPGFTMAADWNVIDITNAIENLDSDAVFQACYDNPTFPNEFCGRIVRDATFQVVDISTGFANAGIRRFAGLTTEIDYGLPVESLPFVPTGDFGQLNFNFKYFYLSRQTVSITGFDFNNNANEPGNARQNFQFNVGYNLGKLSAIFTTDYQGSVELNRANSDESNDVLRLKRYYTFDAAVNYDVNDAVRLRLSVFNIGDREAPFPSTDLTGVYDAIGRRFVTGINVRF